MLPLSWLLFCVFLPWHHLRFVKYLFGVHSYMARCDRCGREYAFNDDARCVLPYSEVKDFYDKLNADLESVSLPALGEAVEERLNRARGLIP